MKQKQIRMPALGFLLSLALYIWLLMPHGDSGMISSSLLSTLRFSFHAVPAFFLQLFVLRATPNKLLRAIPPALLLIPFSFAAFFWVRNHDWDRLGALVFGMISVAPAVGFALAALVHRLSRRKPN